MTTTGHRAFPKFPNPRSFRRIAHAEFELLQKSEMDRTPGIVPGHRDTVVWYVPRDEGGYFVLQVDFDERPSVFIEGLCTFTPTAGVDMVDGMLLEDAEALVLNEQLGYASSRLDVYGSASDVDPLEYLRSRGLAVESSDGTNATRKKWWQFWR
jgi:hypothetical protein